MKVINLQHFRQFRRENPELPVNSLKNLCKSEKNDDFPKKEKNILYFYRAKLKKQLSNER
jgi:hypothetical protein